MAKWHLCISSKFSIYPKLVCEMDHYTSSEFILDNQCHLS